MADISEKTNTIHEESLKPVLTADQSGNVNLVDAAGHVRRIPIPSSDPNDPLNLSKWRKMGVVVTCCLYSIFSLTLVGGAGPILPSWIALYAPQGIGIQKVVNLTTYPSLIMAFGAFTMLPLAMLFGRRPVLIGCCILLIASTVGAAESNSYNTHLACRALQGIATGATESVLPLIVADISFLDERGVLYGAYWGMQNLLGTIFTVTVSYLVADTNWRWFYWLMVILSAVGFLFVLFILPETRYYRGPTSDNGDVWFTDEFGVTQRLSEEEAEERFGTSTQIAVESGANIPKKSYLQSIKPYSSTAPHGLALVGGAISKMVASLSSPAVIWAILMASITLGLTIAMSLSYGTVLITGFGWKPASVGLINCGVFPAAFFAMFFAGFLGDKVNLWLARRDGGLHKPEHILVNLIFPLSVGAVGTAIYGVTAFAPASHGVWGIIMGWTLLEFAFVVVLITTTQFAAEAYPQNPGPALVMVVGMKNIVSFAASFGITPLVHKYNYLTAYMVLLGVYLGIALLGVPIYFFNPKWRAYVGRKQKKNI